MEKSLFEFLQTTSGLLCVLQLLAAGFISITFIQSGLDKVLDYQGNLAWMSGQFSKTFLRGSLKLFLPLLTLCELASGLVTVLGAIGLLFMHSNTLLTAGFGITGVTLLMLLFGQRVSKEYAGAASLTGYFLIVLAGLLAGALNH